MKNVTAECPPPVFRVGAPMPQRGVEGCPCKEKGPLNEFALLADSTGQIVWYARKNCPIHGITVTDLSEPRPTATNSEPSTTAS